MVYIRPKVLFCDRNQVWHVNFEDSDARKTISVPSEKAVSLLKLPRSNSILNRKSSKFHAPLFS